MKAWTTSRTAVLSPRTPPTSGVRRREAAYRCPTPVGLGALAGTDQLHQYRPMDMSQCGLCFGWVDDPRHLAVYR